MAGGIKQALGPEMGLAGGWPLPISETFSLALSGDKGVARGGNEWALTLRVPPSLI